MTELACLLAISVITGFFLTMTARAYLKLKKLKAEQDRLDRIQRAKRQAAYDALKKHEAVMEQIRRKQQQQQAKKTVKWYEFLGVPEYASELEIQRAFKKKAMVMHPDKGGSLHEMVNLNKAREIGLEVRKREARSRK